MLAQYVLKAEKESMENLPYGKIGDVQSHPFVSGWDADGSSKLNTA